MRYDAPKAIGDLIDGALPQLRDRLLEMRIRSAWSALVGSDVARRARPGAIAGRTLEVTVDNSPWLHELTLRSAEVTRAVSTHFPEVTALRFVLGTLAHDDRAVPTDREPRSRRLTDDDRRDIDGAVAHIPDPTLAAAARRLMTRARRFAPEPAPRGAGTSSRAGTGPAPAE
jgi:hypothetical protein